MKVDYHSNFVKHYRERIAPNHTLVKEFQDTLSLFLEEPDNPVLDDHLLKDEKTGWRSFSITGDMRVVYKRIKDGILFYDIGTHAQVY
ncbi:MAG: type II toxin-antitoxin system mRNA interferase toxin, RelE/StbE family [bacterium]|nr:type II toxin-antitoxin system mRNA interferase toxin, RelE/StbE family [bacterium]